MSEDRLICTACGRPWFGLDKCTCPLSKFREKYPEYGRYFSKNFSGDPLNKDPLASKDPLAGKDPLASKDPLAGKDPLASKDPLAGKDPLASKDPLVDLFRPTRLTPERPSSEKTPDPTVRFASGQTPLRPIRCQRETNLFRPLDPTDKCQCTYCKTFGPTKYPYYPKDPEKLRTGLSDPPLLGPRLSTPQKTANQWNEIYTDKNVDESSNKSDKKTLPDDPPSRQGSSSEGSFLDDLEKRTNMQLTRLNNLEEENRRKKNRLLIDSILDPLNLDKSRQNLVNSSYDYFNRYLKGLDISPLDDVYGYEQKEPEPETKCLLDNVQQTCSNPDCDHEDSGEEIVVPNYDKVDTLEKIITIAKTYHCKRNSVYCGIDMKKMFSLVEPLEELQALIGLEENKQKICEQIVFFLKGYMDSTSGANNRDMMHTVITGPPGTGKTTFARIIGKIYSKLGLVSKGHFVEVSREDLVGKYLGHTAPKTNETIDKCLGGIMFIDEVYSLGHSEKRDSFSKECLDVLNQRLSENRDMLCIIAGYREDIEKCFFEQNKGLKRRFPFVYDIEGYSPEELIEIYKMKITRDNWTVDVESLEKLKDRFTEKTFKFYAGDVESFVFKSKIAFAQSNFYSESREIDKRALELALDQMEKDREPKKSREEREADERFEKIKDMMYM